MKEQTIKDLHKVGNEEVRNLLETEFPEVFKPDFGVEEYLKELIESANQIEIGECYVTLRSDGDWILDFRKDRKDYWMNYDSFQKIRQTEGLKKLEANHVCTSILNDLTGWEGSATISGS